LTRVVCLLTTLTDPQGSNAQDTDPQGYNTQDIDDCQTMDVDVSDLTIQYPDVPDKETTITSLLPDAPAAPCTTEFTATLPFMSNCDEDLATSYGGGQDVECYCGAASVDADSSQLPSLPHYLLVNILLGDDFSITDNVWSVNVDGTAFSGDVGQCHESPTNDDPDESPSAPAGFLSAQLAPDEVCHLYGSPSAAAEVSSFETIVHHFLRHGGKVYKSGDTLVTKTWSPMTGTLGQATDDIMMFGAADDSLTVDPCSDSYHSCAVGFCPATTPIQPTTTEFCWYQETDGECQQGCLVYRQLEGTFLQYKRLV